jgi:putative ABC transport system permease protein
MWRMAMRNLVANRGRLTMTFITVILGVTFVASTLFFADSIAPAPGAIRTDVAVLVTPATAEDADGYDFRPSLLPEPERQVLADLPGVASTDGIIDGYAGVVGQDGKVARPAGFADDLIGTNWTDSPRLRLVDGRAPRGPGEIAVEVVAGRNGGLDPGDRTTAVHQAGVDDVTVVGVFSYHPTLRDGPGRAPALAFDTTTAQRVLQAPGTYTAIEITAEPGVSSSDLRERVAAALPPGFAAHDGAQLAVQSRQQEEGDAATAAQILLTFTLIALLVGTTLIANTFAMLVGQRIREFGMLRAVGASRRQISRLVLAEAAGVGLLGTPLGMLVGALLAYPMIRFASGRDAFLGGTLQVTPRAVLASLFVGVAITMLAAWLPARRAAAAPPVVAMHGDILVVGRVLRVRTAVGGGLGIVAALFCLLGLVGNEPPFTVAGVTGGLLLLIAAVLLAAPLARPLIRALVVPVRSIWVTRLAAENALRNPRRTAATVAALLVGVGLATGVAVFGASATEADQAATTRALQAPFVAESLGGGQLTDDTLARLRAVPGVTAMAAVRGETAELDGVVAGDEAMAPVTAIDPAAIGSLLRLEVRSGSPSDLAVGAFVHERLATEHGWSVGETVGVRIDGKPAEVLVTGRYADTALVGSGLLVSDDFADQYFPAGNGGLALIAADRPDSEALQASLVAAVADRPDVRLYDAREYAAERASGYSAFIGIATALLGLSVLIAILGIINTLALSVLERTREVGMLRAIGMRRQSVRAMIRWESALIAIAGGVLGIGAGILLGAMFQHAVLSQSVVRTVLPAAMIAGLLVAMGAAGVLAAEWPARRAARTDVLRAIGSP